jgi:hypothetical protein
VAGVGVGVGAGLDELCEVEHLILGGEAVALRELVGHHVEAVLLGGVVGVGVGVRGQGSGLG